MSLPRRKGVDKQGRRNCGGMRRGTSNGSTVYLILCCEYAPFAEYTTRVPPYEEVIVEQQWARQLLNPLQINENIRSRVDSAMVHHDVFSYPLLAGILVGIRSEYNNM